MTGKTEKTTNYKNVQSLFIKLTAIFSIIAIILFLIGLNLAYAYFENPPVLLIYTARAIVWCCGGIIFSLLAVISILIAIFAKISAKH